MVNHCARGTPCSNDDRNEKFLFGKECHLCNSFCNWIWSDLRLQIISHGKMNSEIFHLGEHWHSSIWGALLKGKTYTPESGTLNHKVVVALQKDPRQGLDWCHASRSYLSMVRNLEALTVPIASFRISLLRTESADPWRNCWTCRFSTSAR